MHDAKEYGSIISVADYDWDLLHQFAAEFDISGEMNLFDSFDIEATQQRLQELVAVGEVLAQKYEVVVTNPPYMGASNMNPKLNEFIKQKYADYKSDFFSAFIIRASEMTKQEGYCGFFTPYVWMFIQSYEKLRKYLYSKATIETLIQFEYSAFEEATVPVCTFAFKNSYINKKGCYLRLVDFRGGMEIQRQKTLEAISNHNCGFYYEQCSDNFAKIPGAPVAYWVNEKFLLCFNKSHLLRNISNPKQGLITGNVNKFVRKWFEISCCNFSIKNDCYFDSKWYPYCNGGNFRKWYGNNEDVVNWYDNGIEVKTFFDENGKLRSRPQNQQFYFKEGGTWTAISSASFSVRYFPKGYIFSNAGMAIFTKKSLLLILIGFLNSKLSQAYLSIYNEGLNYNQGDIAKLPIIDNLDDEMILNKVNQCISLSKSDWDAFETSWDFTKHPLVVTSGQLLVNSDSSANTQLSTTHYPLTTIAQTYQRWEEETNARFAQLKANEEELNRIFIDIYGLQDELTPEVEDKDVTVRKADLQRDIKSLLSYAVGCMFGRYSLDVEGLAFAGGTWDDSKYVTFKPDEDNVIPITDEDYFEDDIIGRLIAWLKVVYGAETLEENLHFIADALGTSGDTARQKIRNYFLKDFFKDHCKIYQKRPIYWLYDSGKQNGFKALIYMHRYNADTSGQVRAEYLGKMEETYESEINRMQDIMDNGAGREVALAGKRKEKLQKQLHECRDYDAVLGHIALASIAIDLDDGVKVNYVKVQTAKDGKLLPILAKI